jgi:hypothetical protein
MREGRDRRRGGPCAPSAGPDEDLLLSQPAPLRPLLVVPGLFSTEIYDDDLGYLWGRFRCLYGGPPLANLGPLRGRPRELLRGIPIVAGLRYDLIGALERALQAGGYRTGETLHFFAYDFRQRVLDLAPTLVSEIRRLARDAGGPVDLLGLSNGGLVIRAAYATDATLPVATVVTSGTPNAGIIETLTCIDRGFRFAPLGRLVRPEEFMACPNGVESIPSPRTAVFLTADGQPSQEGYDLYDVGTWQRLRMSVFRRHPNDPVWIEAVTRRLAEARETWRRFDEAAPPRRLVCICGSGIPTQVGIVIRDGKPFMPGEGNLAGVPPAALADGDGAMSVAHAHAWTGATPEVVRIPVTRHRDTVRRPVAFQAILQALR